MFPAVRQLQSVCASLGMLAHSVEVRGLLLGHFSHVRGAGF